MPTTFRELFKVALELNTINVAASRADAEEEASLSRQTSDGSLEPTLIPCDSLTSLASSSCSMSLDDDHSATTALAAAAAPLPPALHESGSFSSLLGCETDALTEGERGSSLGSTSMEGVPDRSVLHAGSAIESPGAEITGCSRVFAVIQQFEDANSRTRGSKYPSSSPSRRRASTATATTTSSSSLQRRAASQSKQTKEKTAQQQQAKEPRPAMASPGRSTRRSSGGNSNSDVASPSVASRASLYMLAQARDGINEMHPEILERRIQV